MTTQLLSFGKQITNTADGLQPVSLTDVAALVRADATLLHQTARLRKVVAFDREAYRTAKTSLPFVVGATFVDGVRRLDALEAATYFVLDLDHCTGLAGPIQAGPIQAGPIQAGRVPEAIRADLSVAMAFVSPSGEGLKVFFRLLDACTDPKLFSAAYRNFAGDFGVRHGFVKSLDLRTSDASRACFLAHDPGVYLNDDAMPVDWRVWLPNAEATHEETDMDRFGTESTVVARKPLAERPINELAYRDVLRTMNPNAPVRREKQYFVPDELAAIGPAIRVICGQLNWELTELAPLNYGLKVAVKQGFRRAEVNVHWGKRGFSVVKSPKTGTDPALADLLYGQLYQLLFPEPVASTDVLTGMNLSVN